jgi:enoyl-[acyl-carrier protein] reductase II
VDIVIAEGFEAGGHNGRDEITTLALIPQVLKAVKLPVVAAGGIANGQAICAMLALGCAGVQMGTRLLMTKESSAHDNFKQAIITAKASDTELVMKKLVPVRLLKNQFYHAIKKIESTTNEAQALAQLLGKGRAKAGILDGDMLEGELEIGQIAGLIHDIPSVHLLVEHLIAEYKLALNNLNQLRFLND